MANPPTHSLELAKLSEIARLVPKWLLCQPDNS